MLAEAKTKKEIMASLRGVDILEALSIDNEMKEAIKDLRLKLKIENVKGDGIDLVFYKDNKRIGAVDLYYKVEIENYYYYEHCSITTEEDIEKLLSYEGLIDYIGDRKELLHDDFWGDFEVRNTRIYDYDFNWDIDIENSYIETFWDDVYYFTNHYFNNEHVVNDVKEWAVEQGFGDILSKYEIVSYKNKRWSLVRVMGYYYSYQVNISEEDVAKDYPALSKIMDYLYECGKSIFEMAYENYLYHKEEEFA